MGAGRVIALASSEEKRELALELGADAAVDSRADDLQQAIVEANEGRAGRRRARDERRRRPSSRACASLAPFGRIVTFGIASREENAVKTGHLMRNSRAVVGFWLVHLFAARTCCARGSRRSSAPPRPATCGR